MKRVCIVGYGSIGPVHARALSNIQGVELYGICDINPVHLKRGLDSYNTRGFSNYKDVLADPSIDYIHICTPHYLHYEMICQALDAGKGVVTEKPITITEEQYRKLLMIENIDKVCVILQNRYNPCVIKLKSIISTGQLGKICGIKGIVTWCRTKDYYEKEAWRGKWETEGGGALINQSIHTLDLISYLAGNIESVSASMCNHSLKNVIEVEDTITAHLQIENNVSGFLFATNAYCSNSLPYIEVIFENGCARYMDGQLWINGVLTEEDQKPISGKSYWGTGHAALLKQYYEAGYYFSPASIKNTMLSVFAAYKSATQGTAVIPVCE